METPIIQIQNLTKQYDDVTAVNDLTLSIRRGEVFGLLGPNGAGKTTTTLMLLGLSEPTAGTACVGGIDCIRNPIIVKRSVGYLPDNVGFYTDMTGRENLRLTGNMNGLKGQALEERVSLLLERVGMTESADRKTSTYSKGMKQRLGIADILVKDPDVLIMDEPTNGIDPKGMRELIALIRSLAEKEEKTILISSHQLYQIQQICDRVGIFVKGRLIACGRIDELGQQLEGVQGYALELRTEPPEAGLEALIRSVQGVKGAEWEDGTWIVTAERDVSGEIVKALVEHGELVTHIRQRSSDLDEIYAQYFKEAGDIHAVGENAARAQGAKRNLRKRRA